MPLKLIHGPPNSGRAGLVRRRFVAALERDPVLVVPTVDDVFAFERELCAEGAALGGAAMTFGALFRTVATAGGVPPGAELSPAQRLRAIEVAVDGAPAAARAAAALRLAPRLRPRLRAAARRAAGGRGRARRGRGERRDPGGLRLPRRHRHPLRRLRRGARAQRPGRLARDRPRGDRAAAPRRLLLGRAGPVFLYGLDDLTPNQFELVAALAALTEVTVALPLRGGQRGAGGALAPARRAARADRRGRGDPTEADAGEHRERAALRTSPAASALPEREPRRARRRT